MRCVGLFKLFIDSMRYNLHDNELHELFVLIIFLVDGDILRLISRVGVAYNVFQLFHHRFFLRS